MIRKTKSSSGQSGVSNIIVSMGMMRSLSRRVRRIRRSKIATAWPLALALIVISIGAARHVMQSTIDPSVYQPILATIAKGESNGNYNAHYGNAANTTIRFTDMSVEEVLRWQEAYARQGSFSSAVGKYQIVRPTLTGLVAQLKIDPQARFDEALQDRMAVALLERRGAVAYIRKELSREQFAANLAQEWAALPKVQGTNPEQSYYASDGVNTSHLRIEEVYRALIRVQELHEHPDS